MENEMVTISIEKFAALIAAYERYKIVKEYVKESVEDKDAYVDDRVLKNILCIGEEKK